MGRDSNMELLRIVAMSMIVVGHFFFHGLRPIHHFDVTHLVSMPFTICGVNLFFLISGWFGMKLSVRGVVRLVVTTAFFILVSLGVTCLVGNPPKLDFWNLVLFPISGSGYWFIMVYLGLMLLSPLLNAGLRGLTSGQLTVLVVTLTVFNIYSCWLGGNYTNPNGYTLPQAIWLYCTAYWLRVHWDRLSKVSIWWFLAAFLLFTGLSEWMLVAMKKTSYMHYNSVFVVLPSVALFLFFAGLRLRSSVVNYIARASFGCYLLEDGLIGKQWLYGLIAKSYKASFAEYGDTGGVSMVILFFAAILLSIWVASLLLTPLSDWLSKQCSQLIERLIGQCGSGFKCNRPGTE